MLRRPLTPLVVAAALAFVASDAPASARPSRTARPGVAAASRALAQRAATTVPTRAPLTVVTFNAGLAPGAVARSEERAPRVVEALREEPYDVLCAQEVWLETDYVALHAALAERTPHVVRTPREPPPAASCRPGDIASLEACHRASCSAAGGAPLAECMIARCAHLAMSLPSTCIACLTREPWKTLADARAACTAPGEVAPRRPAPAADGRATPRVAPSSGALAFGGSDGVVLASRFPFAETATLRLPSAFSQRVIHHARLAQSPVGPVHLFCTHLSAPLGSMPHPGGGTWDDEHAAQVGALGAWIEERTRAAPGPTIVAGDLNMGPAIPGKVTSRRAGQFERLIATGFAAPYATKPDAACTFCDDNPLRGGSPGTPGGTILDHVLVRGFDGTVTTRRVLGPTSPTRRADALSDHHGLSATFLAR